MICTPSRLLASAAAISFSPLSFGTSQLSIVNGSVVEPILPSRDTRIGVSSATWSTFLASVRNASMCSLAAALCAPAGSFHTT